MSLTWASNNGTTWPLDGSFGVMVVGEAEGIFSIPTDLLIDQRMGADGGVLAGRRRYAPRRVGMELLLEATQEVLTLWRQLLSALAAGGSLVYEGDFGSKQLRLCELEAPDRSMTGQDLRFRINDVIPLSLIALDPWWTDVDASTMVLPIAEPTAYDAPVSYSLLLPYSGGSSLVVTVAGDTAAFPDFYVRGPFATLTVSINGLSWTLANPLGDGVEMTVRADTSFELVSGGRGPMMATNNQVDWSLLTEASLMPTLPVGDTSVVVGGTGTGANSACSMSWVGRWLSP